MRKGKRVCSIFLLIALVSTLFIGCSRSDQPNSSGHSGSKGLTENQGDDKNTKMAAGRTIRFLAANHSWLDASRPMFDQFTRETGIKVDLEIFTEAQLSNKIAVESTANIDSMDVFMMRPQAEARLFASNGWLECVDTFAAKDSSYNAEDIFSTALKDISFDGKLFGIPIISERTVMYYRKDLFQKNNLMVPASFEELEKTARVLTDKSTNMYGIVMRGQISAAPAIFSNFLYSFGGNMNPVNGKAALNTPEAIMSFKYYGNLLKNYGPPGVLNMNWPEASAVFMQGNAAMFIDADSLYQRLISPDKSKVADKVGYALFPKGPKGAVPWNMCSWALGISSYSKQKDASWEFVKWITSKDRTREIQKKGVTCARKSAWDDAEVTKSMPQDLVAVINKTIEIGTNNVLPKVVKVQEARDIVGTVITVAISGGNVEDAAAAANKNYQTLIDKEGK